MTIHRPVKGLKGAFRSKVFVRSLYVWVTKHQRNCRYSKLVSAPNTSITKTLESAEMPKQRLTVKGDLQPQSANIDFVVKSFFVDSISEFVQFLSLHDHKVEEILANLVLRVLAPIECTGIFMSQVKPDGTVELVAKYGIHPNLFDTYPVGISLKEKWPITDALRSRRTVWVNTLPDWGDEYPHLAVKPYPFDEKTFICWSIERFGTPVACMGVFCKSVVPPDIEVDSFLKAVGSIMSLYMYREGTEPYEIRMARNQSSIGNGNLLGMPLTERQALIVKLMADGKTNASISDLLGYSESTIRQESIKIYAKLGCSGRTDAARIYRETMVDSSHNSQDAR